MRKLILLLALGIALVPAVGSAVPPEGCVAYAPAGSGTCNFTVTHADTAAGYIAVGNGCFTIKRDPVGIPPPVVVASACSPGAQFSNTLPPCIVSDVWSASVTANMFLIMGCPT